MTIKFTTTEQESSKVELLFEFLDHEAPEDVSIDLETKMGKNQFVGNLQSHQINGIYLEPIVLKGRFYGNYWNANGKKITALERSQELGRLQGRPVKFFWEKIKQIVIIESFKRNYKNVNNVHYELIIVPHDLQAQVTPSGLARLREQSVKILEEAKVDEADKEFGKEWYEGISELPIKPKEFSLPISSESGILSPKQIVKEGIKTEGLSQEAIRKNNAVSTNGININGPLTSSFSKNIQKGKEF